MPNPDKWPEKNIDGWIKYKLPVSGEVVGTAWWEVEEGKALHSVYIMESTDGKLRTTDWSVSPLIEYLTEKYSIGSMSLDTEAFYDDD